METKKTFRVLRCAVVLFATGTVGACRNGTPEKRSSRTIDTVSVRQEWFPNANYAGPLLASTHFAHDHRLAINIQPGSENIDPVTQVVSGRDQFGEAGADRVLAAIDKGAPLQIVAVIHPNSPTVFLAKASSGISTPAAFRGRRIGVLTGTATEYVYRALLQKSGLRSTDVSEVEAGFDLTGFLAGVYEVRPAFAYDEPVSLARQNVPVVEIRPSQYGVHFVGTVYFARADYVRTHHDVVQHFVSAMIDGWRLAISDPPSAIGELRRRYPDLDSLRELESLHRAIEYVQPLGDSVPPFRASPEDWQSTLAALRSLNVARNVQLAGVVNDEFVTAYFTDPRVD